MEWEIGLFGERLSRGENVRMCFGDAVERVVTGRIGRRGRGGRRVNV